MKFRTYSQRAILLFAVLAILLPLPLEQRYMFIGAVILYVGIHNFICLKLSQKEGNPPQKLIVFVEKFGKGTGTVVYLFTSMFVPILLGIYILYVGFNMENIPMSEGLFSGSK